MPSQSSITSTVLSDMIDDSRRFGGRTGYSTPNSAISNNHMSGQLPEAKQVMKSGVNSVQSVKISVPVSQ